MQRHNKSANTECCSRRGQEGAPPEGASRRTNLEKRTQGTSRAASGSRISLKQFSVESSLSADGERVFNFAPETDGAVSVRLRRVCRRLRAWQVKREFAETWEALRFPGVLTARTNRVGLLNLKKSSRGARRDSDRSIVARGNPAQARPTRVKGLTHRRRTQKETSSVRMTGSAGQPPCVHREKAQAGDVKSPVRENCSPGSVRGARSNPRPYLDIRNAHCGQLRRR
jgi:hypothetical protein